MLGAASVLVVHARWWVLVGVFFFFLNTSDSQRKRGKGHLE